MASPIESLISDVAAERFECEAQAILAAAPLLPSAMESLAVSVIALVRDRAARIELSALERLL